MKKIGVYFLVVLLSIIVFLFGFGHQTSKQPKAYYNVYLDGELIGTIESKEELENYINNQADTIRDNVRKYLTELDAIETYTKYNYYINNDSYSHFDKVTYLLSNKEVYNLSEIEVNNLNTYLDEKLYNLSTIQIDEMKEYVNQNNIYQHTDNVYTPNGIEIKKVYTYHQDILPVTEVYKRIISKKTCTVAGYRFTIKSKTNDKEDIVINTIDKKIFSDAIESLITIFVDENKYMAYKNDTQSDITSTGSLIENIYIDEDITYKAVNISIDEKIYTDAKDLSAYLLYGEQFEERNVQVKVGDSIESLALENKISVQEFLIFNPQYTSRNNLLVAGTNVVISKVDPKIQIVVETYEVVDKETTASPVERYDETLSQGSIIISEQGKSGIERVTQNVKSINGEITYVKPLDRETISSPVPRVITIGTKYVPSIGSTASWGWPTNSGYTITSYYGYRLSVFAEGNFHSGIDIAGTGYGSPIYATNNGVIEVIKDLGNTSYGKHIIINHNNGYYTLYGHMSGFKAGLTKGSTVARGDIIGYVGSSGWATGPHVHYEIRTCPSYSCITNPLRFY